MTTTYKELDIIKSKNLAKKYTAILIDSKGKKYYIDFGDSSKGHYRDDTKIKHYSHLDLCYTSRGQQLQELFKEKNNFIKKFTPLYFSAKYLWAMNV